MAENLNDALGQIVKIHRNAKKLSLEKLSKMILKSKATLCKYENGSGSMDIETLGLIAEALDVKADFLIREANALLSPDKTQQNTSEQALIEYYLYFYDGRFKKLRRSLIRIAPGESSDALAYLFYMIEDWEHPDSCQVFYKGIVHREPPCVSYYFTNTTNPMEKMSLIAREPFAMNGIMGGLLTGISIISIEPICFKALHSETRLTEDKALCEALIIGKENLSKLKKHNGLTIEEAEGGFFSRQRK